MFDLPAVQSALRQFGLDGWLLCDFRGSNLLARRVLDMADRQTASRRFFYAVPAQGEPRKLVHRIEQGALDHLPGTRQVYLTWRELESGVAALLSGMRRVAMEYSPRNANPYVARVDAGTVELVKSLGIEVVSSGDLIQQFEAVWDDAAWTSHQHSARLLATSFERAWAFIAQEVRAKGSVRETQVQQAILEYFAANDLMADHPPIVAVGPHSGDPHYTPDPNTDAAIGEGDFVLIDQWAKLKAPGAVYSDYTRVGFVGKAVPGEFESVFQIVAAARDAGIALVREAFAADRIIHGWQVDQVVRDVIAAAGYGEFFVHRTGHSIGQETHGNGANIDNLETRDERRVLRRTCFSIEPGIYLADFGVRSEVNVFVDAAGNVHVTGGAPQTRVTAIMDY